MGVYLYATVICFLGISCYQAWRYANMPLHGRMELYPVPGEKGHHHGGSYYEQAGWWERPRETSGGTEVKEMLKEMLFIKKLFANQKPFWWLSYALHLGLYLLIAWTVLTVVCAISILSGLTGGPGLPAWFGLLCFLSDLVGIVGFVLTGVGAAALFLRRTVDNVLKKYTTPQEYFNLILLFAVAVSGLLAWGMGRVDGPPRTVAGMLTFDAPVLTFSQTVHFVLLGIAWVYIPLSKMSHYVGKYFSFHKVLWENQPNLPGSEIERQVIQAAMLPANRTWAAPHVAGGSGQAVNR